MDVPFVDLQANFERYRDEFKSTIEQVLSNGWYIGGEQVRTFEERFAEYLGVDHVVSVASGTDAIRLTLEAMGADSTTDVATVSHTFVSSVDGIAHNDANPIFVDIDSETYTMNPELLEEAITKETEILLPVHLYGQPANLRPIRDVAENHGIEIVEDACQAHGATYQGTRVGSIGKAACFSFYPTKNLGCYGDGGAVATDDDALAAKLRTLREYGQTEKYHYDEIGYNSRLDTLQAAVLSEKLKYLEEWNSQRQEAAELYDAMLERTPLITPISREDVQHVYHLYVVRARSKKERDSLRSFLEEDGIGTGIHYPVPVHEQESYRSYGYVSSGLPVTERISDEILSLPLYPEITEEQQRFVVESISNFYRSA